MAMFRLRLHMVWSIVNGTYPSHGHPMILVFHGKGTVCRCKCGRAWAS